MRFHSLVLPFLVVVRTGAFQAPLVLPELGDPARVVPSADTKNGDEQLTYDTADEPGFPVPGFPPPDAHRVPVVPFQNLQYLTGIALGTPAQTFRALIDISWSGVLVPSAACKNRRFGICNGHFNYQSAWSRSHVATSTELRNQLLAGLRYDATISRDTLSIAGIEILDQDFTEATSVDTSPLAFFADGMDAVLGLAPDSSTSPANVSGPLRNLIKRGLLDRNIVSILLGRWVRRRNMRDGELIHGELMLGGINEELMLPNTTMKFLTMSNKTDPPGTPESSRFCNNTWQVPARAVSMVWFNETLGANQTERVELGESWTARLDTTQTFVTVPERIDTVLRKLADPFQVPYFYPFISCEQRAELPDLVFTLGSGNEAQEFVLTANDYTLEADLLGYGKQCLWTVTRGYGGWDDTEVMALGNPFVRAFYLALDSDNKKVGIGVPWWRNSV